MLSETSVSAWIPALHAGMTKGSPLTDRGGLEKSTVRLNNEVTWMKFYRLYTGDDNQSHFEKMDDHVASNLFNTVHAVKGLVFRIEDRPHLFAWHPAPRRQWVITLSGSVEIGLGDGSSMIFGAGDVFLAEDVTGQGHTAKPKDWVRAFVHLND